MPMVRLMQLFGSSQYLNSIHALLARLMMLRVFLLLKIYRRGEDTEYHALVANQLEIPSKQALNFLSASCFTALLKFKSTITRVDYSWLTFGT